MLELIPLKIRSFLTSIKSGSITGNTSTGDGGYTYVGNGNKSNKRNIEAFSGPDFVEIEGNPEDIGRPGMSKTPGAFSVQETNEHNCVEEEQGNLIFYTCLECGYQSSRNIETGQVTVYSDNGQHYHSH